MTPLQLEDFKKLNLSFDMEGVLRSLFSENITDTDTFMVATPQFLTQFDSLLNETDSRTIANYLMARVVKTAEEDWTIHYSSQDSNSESLCFSFIRNTLLGFPLTALHVRRYMDNETIRQVGEIYDNIRDAAVYGISHLNWLDEETRQAAIDKVLNVKVNVGFVKEVLDEDFMGDIFEGLDFPDNVTSYEMSLLLYKHQTYLIAKNWKVRSVVWDLASYATVVNLYHVYEHNVVQLNEAFLRDRLFDKDRPKFLNYGSIGPFVGHEIFHGLERDGTYYDKIGRLVKDSWIRDNTTREEFINRTACIKNQFAKSFKEDGLNKLNATKTLNNDIADNCGLKYAYLAWQKLVSMFGHEQHLATLDYTPTQLFFISVALVSNFLMTRQSTLDKVTRFVQPKV